MLHTVNVDFTGIPVDVSAGEPVFLGLKIEACLLIRRITVWNHDKNLKETVERCISLLLIYYPFYLFLFLLE